MNVGKFNLALTVILVLLIVYGYGFDGDVYNVTRMWQEAGPKHKASQQEILRKRILLEQQLSRYLADVDSLFLHEERIYSEGWDTLPQPRFWFNIMKMDKDSSIINLEKGRHIKDTVLSDIFWELPWRGKEKYVDSLKEAYGMTKQEEVFVTPGKKHFYVFDRITPSITKSIAVFREVGVDPFYAQAILLIESPARLQKSQMGAYGNFQLMKRVARAYGLQVNRNIDEREDLEKSARVAARILKQEYIPYIEEILQRQGIAYDKDELWFKLLVLHVYHAGHGTIRSVLRHIDAKEGNQELIKELWVTNYRNFQNASQNYSQVALASMIHFDRLMRKSYNLDPELTLAEARHQRDSLQKLLPSIP